MADSTFLPPDHARPEPRGGSARPSLLVDVHQFPNVARRLDLNARLLARTCPFDASEQPAAFGPDDLDLLLLAAGERFGASR